MPAHTDTSPEPRHRTRAVILVLAALILLVLAALVAAPALIPTEPLRRTAESRAAESLERPVAIGALSLRLLPRPAIQVNDVRVGALEDDATESLARIDRARAHVSPLPLFARQVVITEIIVDGGTVTVERRPDGTLSVADLVDVAEPVEEPGWEVSIGEVTVRDVAVVFVDRAVVPGETVTTHLHGSRGWLRLDRLAERIPFDLQMGLFDESRRNLRIAGHVPMPVDEAVEDVLGAADPEAGAPSQPIALQVTASNLPTAPLAPYLGDFSGRVPADVSADLAIEGDLAATVSVSGWAEPWPGMAFSLSGNVIPAADPIRLGIDFALEDAALDRILTIPILGEQVPEPIRARGRIDVRGRVAGTFDDLRATGWSEVASGAIAAGVFAGGPSGEGGMALEVEALRIAFNGRLQDDRDPRIDMDARARALILDFEAADDPPDEPPELPDAFVTARLRVAEGRLLALDYRRLDARMTIEEGRIALQPTLEAHGGRMRARLDADLAPTPASLRLQLDVEEVDAGSLTEALTDVEDVVQGRLSTALIVGWRGLSWAGLERTATGEGSMHLEEGRIATLDVHPEVAQALIDVAVAIGMLPPEEVAEPTVGDIRADFAITEGRVFTEALEVDGDFVRILVRGSVGLDQTVDVIGSFAFSPAAADRFGPVGQVLRGEDGWLSVPFSVNGTVAEPEVSVDVGALLARAATGILGDAEGRWEALRRLWREHGPPAG